MSKINFAGPGIQALLEAWSAVVPIFRLIKEVCESRSLFMIAYDVVSLISIL